ncbi:MAG: WHG domain-containing protein [Blautia sp.]|nr:WHG domain-containing protein [Blautia sp.]MCM1202290.1 WHG domain-containing protein [Bacteroides fragilis]
MPPKAKFTKQEILQKALEIVRTEGIDRLTSRELGARLNSSARPVFTVFENMEEVRQEVFQYAKELYRQYIEQGLKADLPFKGVGVSYITFAMEEPRLFQLLFMSAPAAEKDSEKAVSANISQILPLIDASYEKILHSVQESYGLDRQTADRLYRHLWIYTHGIATMCANRLCSYTMEQISEMMTEVFKGLLFLIKNKTQ